MTTEQTPDHAAEAPAEDLPLEDVIETLRAELEQVRAQSLIDRADLENQRRRMERDVQNACRFANKQLLGDLLPVFDSLDAALAAAGGSGPLHDGVELTLRELHRVTGNQGLVQIAPAAGEAFNPELHQAMSVVEASGVEAGAVAQLFQKGYRLNEQLLRPAMVAVARAD
ncbi:nucleotide exchange factor GrpE [Luteimonas sp. Sa2BVA3]|uniref:Protein GrpE n=1 Tax=Luteimonas colneyensis TaxID=2762230 RepID=A0ABR8UF13_9GAMM|nr:nucleotide exchange factor GrpE [Luteimonas colneyensis]MBD7986619.1 nucleotide exchange factor GrpE [Luteimonas colneyensis]